MLDRGLQSTASPRFVVFLAITHTQPDQNTVGIKIPAKVSAMTVSW